jgi:hypothetical protein
MPAVQQTIDQVRRIDCGTPVPGSALSAKELEQLTAVIGVLTTA